MNRITLNIAAMFLSATAIAAAAQPANDSFVGTLANGVSIEVVGISENPSHSRPWWKADGSPLNHALYDALDAQVDAPPGCIAREVAVRINPRITNLPDDADITWTVLHNDGKSKGDILHSSQRGLKAKAFAVNDSPDGITIRVQVAAGEWTTQYTTNGNGSAAQSNGGLFGLHHQSILFGPPVTDHGKTTVVMAFSGIADVDADFRLVAVDRSGREFPAQTLSSVDDDTTTIAQFQSDLKPDSIKQWKLQSRPYNQWIEIRHVALHPRQNTKIETATSDNG